MIHDTLSMLSSVGHEVHHVVDGLLHLLLCVRHQLLVVRVLGRLLADEGAHADGEQRVDDGAEGATQGVGGVQVDI